MKDCCEKCFVPSKDGDYILPSGHSVVTAYPEGCKDEDCPCHAPQDTQWEKELHSLLSAEDAYLHGASAGVPNPIVRTPIFEFVSNLLASERTRLATAVEGLMTIESVGTTTEEIAANNALEHAANLIRRHSPNK